MLWQQLVNGTILGATYALVALGYSLVFGTLRRVNLAHGEVMMVGGYGAALVVAATSPNIVVALVAGGLVAGLTSVLVYLVSFRLISATAEMASLVSTLAVAAVIRGVVIQQYGSEPHVYPELVSAEGFSFAGAVISWNQIAVLVTSLALFAALQWMIHRTWIGLRIRAVSESSAVAALSGVNATRVFLVVFFTSGVMAGVAGVLIGTQYGAISPWSGVLIGLKGIAIMVVGGLGDLNGVLAASFVMAISETLVTAYWHAGVKDGVTFAILLAVLIFRPQGLFASTAGRRD
jgi:branched-chain amino acid transport system permease protein